MTGDGLNGSLGEFIGQARDASPVIQSMSEEALRVQAQLEQTLATAQHPDALGAQEQFAAFSRNLGRAAMHHHAYMALIESYRGSI